MQTDRSYFPCCLSVSDSDLDVVGDNAVVDEAADEEEEDEHE